MDNDMEVARDAVIESFVALTDCYTFPDCTASHARKLRRAKAYVAKLGVRPYSSVPTVLLPVAQRRVQREQERRT